MDAPPDVAGRAGRRLATGGFWALIALGAVGLFGNLLWQVYGAVPAANSRLRRPWCVAQIAGLARELQDRSLEALATPLDPTAPSLATGQWQAWRRRWGLRQAEVVDSCRDDGAILADACATLVSLAEAHDDQIERDNEITAALAAHLQQGLQRLR